MLNKEKYAKEIIDIAITGDDIALKYNIPIKCSKMLCNGCERKSSIDCCSEKKLFEWANSEYKESILDEVEKRYLRGVIRPFRNEVKSIRKKIQDGEIYEFILIELSFDVLILPRFEKGTMYKGMVTNKEYTLDELGL